MGGGSGEGAMDGERPQMRCEEISSTEQRAEGRHYQILQ